MTTQNCWIEEISTLPNASSIMEEIYAAWAEGKHYTTPRHITEAEAQLWDFDGCCGATWVGEEHGGRKGSILMCPRKILTFIHYSSHTHGRGRPGTLCERCATMLTPNPDDLTVFVGLPFEKE
jgi:hypothetical protein